MSLSDREVDDDRDEQPHNDIGDDKFVKLLFNTPGRKAKIMSKNPLGVGTIALVFFFMLTALGNTTPSFAETMGETQEKSLYERLGGYDAISGVVDVFLTKIWEDPVVGRFFVGMGTDTRNLLSQKNKNLLCANTGGPCKKNQSPIG